MFSSPKSSLFMSLSDTTFKSNLSGADLIQKESQVMLRKGQWSTFIYVLDLASVIGKRIFCHYPDFGEAKVKLLFNQCILPRSYYEGSSSSFEIFNVLFCQLAKGTQSFKANHFVPLILHTKKSKKRLPSSDIVHQVPFCKNKKVSFSKSSQYSPFFGKSIYSYFKKENTGMTFHSVAASVTSSVITTVSSSDKLCKTSSSLHSPLISSVSSTNSTSICSTVSSDISLAFLPGVSSISSDVPSPLNTTSISVSSNNCSSLFSPPLISSTQSVLLSDTPITVSSNNFSASPDSHVPSLLFDNSVSSSYLNTLPGGFFSKPASTSSASKNVEPINKPSSTFAGANSKGTSKYDIATYFVKSKEELKDVEIHDLIKNVFVPDAKFIFPKSSGKRAFRHAWLDHHSWLYYSAIEDGGFCLPCSLFSRKAPQKLQKVSTLVSKAAKASNDATSNFKKHEAAKDGLHSFCVEVMTSFLSNFSGKSLKISTLVDNLRVQKVKENRSLLVPLIDTTLLCGRLGLSFRGHRDASSSYPTCGEMSVSSGVGNFIELLNFAIRRGDSTLEKHYKDHKKNASYLSPKSQNDLIQSCGNIIVQDIVSEIKTNNFFSILADEAMDASGKEQLSFTVRYVDRNDDIKEDFLGFVHLDEGLSGKSLAASILKKISDLGLNIENCRGQGYDGAGSMAGYKNGCSANILSKNKKAIYTHCFSHRLNLAISKANNILSVENMMSVVQKISVFFKFSEQRRLAFELSVAKYCPGSTRNQIKDPCRTRWIERILSLGEVVNLYPALWHTLEDMRLNVDKKFNSKTQKDAFSFFKAIDSFDFLINLVVTFKIFDFTLLVTELLQSKKNDIADGIHMIESLISLFFSIRKKSDTYHAMWYEEAVGLANKFKIAVKTPRITKRQILRDNHPSNSTSEYYRHSLTIPLLDHVYGDLTTRFSQDSLVSYTGLYLIPSKIVSLNNQSSEKSLKDLLFPFLQFYEDDFPSVNLIGPEIELWERYWLTNKEICPSNVSNTLKSINFEGFPNIKVALKILATLPITSCECERSFSGLRRLKTYTRTTMTNDRLNGLALMQFHLDRVPETERIINEFAGMKQRRLELIL